MEREELLRRLRDLPQEEVEKLTAYLSRHVPRGADPRDALHDTLLVALEQAGKFREDANLAAWLNGIAKHVAHDLRKAASVRGKHIEAGSESIASAVGHEPMPGATAAEDEERARVRAAIDALPSQLALVIDLTYVSGLTQEEIAETLGCSVPTVKNRIAEAREQLAERLRDLQA